MSKKKLLWVSDSPRIPFVGQSVVARECLSRLQEHYDVSALGFSDGGLTEQNHPENVPYKVIPCDRQDMVNPEKLVGFVRDAAPDALLFSHDPWLFPLIGTLKAHLPNVRYLGWLTVDGDPAYYKWHSMIKPYDKVITPTVHGKNTLLDRWMDLNIDVVPYGVRPEVWHPPAQGKSKLKAELQQLFRVNLLNKFLVIYVGANQDRKNLGLQHEAWQIFEKNKPDVVFMMFTHGASLKNEMLGTYDLSCFIHETRNLALIDKPQPLEWIGASVAASDCLFHPSNGEGFGLTVAEAMACQTVPITIKYAGLTDFVTEENSYCIPFIKHVGGYHVHRAVASAEETAKQLELAYADFLSGAITKKAELAEKAVERFRWDATAAGLRKSIDETLYYPTNTHLSAAQIA